MEQRIQDLEKEIAQLKQMLDFFVKPDQFTFERNAQFRGNKIGFFTTTPVSKYSLSFNAVPSGTYGGPEQATLNGIRLALISYGLIKP